MRFYTANHVRMPRVKALAKWVKKYAKFGAYMVVDEVPDKMKPVNHPRRKNDLDLYNVQLFCPKIRIDINGKFSIKEP